MCRELAVYTTLFIIVINGRFMTRSIYALLLFLLCGCAPTLVASNKVASYKEAITHLAILVAEPSEMKGKGTGMYAGSANSRAGSAVSALNVALRSRLAHFFSANGIPSESVVASDKTTEKHSHRLVITPSSASASCYYARCQATVRIGAALQDSRSLAIVWRGTFDVPEASSFDTIDTETASKVGAIILGALRSANLVAAR